MDNVSTEQLSVALSQPSHRMNLTYPVNSLLNFNDEIEEEIWMKHIHDKQNRYNPGPLVDNGPIIHNSDRCTKAESSYFLLSQACPELWTPVNPGVLSDDDDGKDHGLKELVSDSQLVLSTTVGITNLSMTTCCALDRLPIEEEYEIRVCRQSFYVNPHNRQKPLQSEAMYIFLPAELEAYDESAPPIVLAMQDLIFRKTDRAVLHVRAQLAEIGYIELESDEDRGWKPARKQDAGVALRAISKPVEVSDLPDNEVDRACHICQENFGEEVPEIGKPAELPVSVCCQGKHIFGEECLRLWCASKSPEDITCPTCRGTLFTPDEARALAWGEVHGEFRDDPRYSDYENRIRSYADLDRYNDHGHCLHRPGPLQVEINAAVLSAAVNILLADARLEPSSSTPAFLNPVNFDEVHLLIDAIMVQLVALDGTTMSLDAIRAAIYLTTQREAARCLNKMHINLFDALIGSDPDYNDVSLLRPFRPSTADFVFRLMFRAVRFQMVRFCVCASDVHKHGDREYWGPLFLLQNQTAANRNEPEDMVTEN